MSSKKNSPNIKVKLLLGYTLTIIVLIVAGFTTYISFTKLFDSVETLARPDAKFIMLNHMLTDISEAEGSLRSYILSNEKAHLKAYEVTLDSIMKNISALKKASVEDPTQLNKLDSISILLKAKYDAIDNLAILAKQSRNNSLSTTALDKIRATRFDSAKIDTTLMTYTETTTHIKPRGIIDDEEKKPEPKGLFQAIKNIFSSKNDDEKSSKEEDEEQKDESFYTETKITIDTSIVSAYQTDSILSNIKKILSDVQKKESALNRLLNAKQLEVLEQDRLIMDKIRLIVTSIERREIIKAEQQTQKAKTLADKFSFTILAVGIFGLLAGTVLVLLILHDINKSNYYKEQLEKAKNKAEHLAKAKEEFLANMSHEIRTPLNAIQGFTEQLLQTSLQANQKEYLRAVEQSSEHLLSTVNDILDFSKIEVGKLAIEKIPFQPEKVLEEVYTLLKLKAVEKKLAFNYFIEEDCPKDLIGDPFRLKQILFNLVGNALKFTESGSVFITCKSRKAFASPKRVILTLEVKDTGVGISKENITKIFEGFQQADSSTTRQFGGTGLGLTICKNLVELQQGVLLVESEEGKGSTFSINIPYELSNVKTEEMRLPLFRNSRTIPGIKILIIDDDVLNIMLLNTILTKHGAVITQANNGIAGVEKTKEQGFDLIITDIQMPHMSGFELAKAIRSPENKNFKTPIIGLSAHVTYKEKKMGRKAGITEMLSKPFKEDFLLEKIAKVLGMTTSEIPTEKNQQNEGSENFLELPGYNLSSFDSFVKGDKKVLIHLLSTLAKDQKKNLELLKRSIEKNNLQDTSSIAHKMTASFGYLKADSIVDKLKKLETATKTENTSGAFKEAVESIAEEANLLITDLEKKIAVIQNESLPA